MRRYMAEAIGTFGIVLSGCGAALVGGARLGDAGVALAFGLSLAAMLFAAGPISGGHFNPAVTLAMALSGRLPGRDVVPYIAAQIGGGVAGAGAVITMANGRPGGAPRAAEAIANGFGRHSPGFYGVASALLAEITLTALFVFVFLSVSVSMSPRPVHLGPLPRLRPPVSPPPSSSAALPLAAGAAYALIHLVGLPVTRLAANPARALGPALLAGGAALEQVWLFIAAPIAGGLLAALAHRYLRGPHAAPAADTAPTSAEG
jgi:aquaporin Z